VRIEPLAKPIDWLGVSSMVRLPARMAEMRVCGTHALMVIYNLYVFDAAVRPNETDAVFIIDTNGVLAFAVTVEWFQPVAPWPS